MTTLTPLRPELEPLPSRMQDLPVDERGYPVPWFVDWLDGKPEFRAMSPKKWVKAVNEKLCWVCGERMGRFMTFLIGPMCGINRTTAEPPCHLECARWSARNCPFLNNPEAIRRVDEIVGQSGKCIGGFAIQRNPGVALLWTTKTYSVFPDSKGGYLITVGDPEVVEFWKEKRPATRAEIQHSIAGGLPALVAMAMQEAGAMKMLEEMRGAFDKYLPLE